jgi:ribosomal protein L37AE/L43A
MGWLVKYNRQFIRLYNIGMTVEKRLSIKLTEITAVQFHCAKCGSVLSQTKPSVVYECAGCGVKWRERSQQDYMLAIDNFLKTLERLKNREENDPGVEIALEFQE